jgi:hypothetical protein
MMRSSYAYKVLFLLLTGLFPSCLFAQTSPQDSASLELYADTYLAIIPEDLQLKQRPDFIYNYTTTNRPALNLGLLRFQYAGSFFRTQIALIGGTYSRRNLRQEAAWARNIGEASIGFRISRKENLWLDAGVLPSHIGNESYIGKENQAATRALISDQTPYYETGLRVSYRPSSRWYLSMMALNGWQRITAPADQFGANWGMQIQYTPNENILLNNSNFIGKVPVEQEYKLRLYSNSYARFGLGKNDWLFLGWDIGVQDHHLRKGVRVWNGLLAQWRHLFCDHKWALLFRAERIADPQRVLYADSAGNRFLVSHVSAGIDWAPNQQLLLRLEGNALLSGQGLFRINNTPSQSLPGIYILASYSLRRRF